MKLLRNELLISKFRDTNNCIEGIKGCIMDISQVEKLNLRYRKFNIEISRIVSGYRKENDRYRE